MEIKRNGSQPSGKGPAEWFTGAVRIDPLFKAPDPARVSGASVTFEPGARTAWHTHPLGQTLIVISGTGRVQRSGGPYRRHWAGRRRVVCTRREALARRLAHDGNDPHSHCGGAQWQGRRLDGARQRRTIQCLLDLDAKLTGMCQERSTDQCPLSPRKWASQRAIGTSAKCQRQIQCIAAKRLSLKLDRVGDRHCHRIGIDARHRRRG